ncbi:capsid and scaffold protein [Pseudomonas phage PHB09]|uniref:Capsid and scaffold protein n=1 Tax=Pseudomonas phage PHB09 TaxID=2867265 RepID=A0AAE8XC71_9CAUD|nr:capsid and scaffold protein [Pseudomonas phage PHB09]UAV84531.1 capsid and scaffold protein [Pseudomonas phage PHB09]
MTLVEAIADLIEKHFGGSKESTEVVEVTKALDVEDRKALFVVLEPDCVDLHGDTYTAVEVEKACDNYNEHCRVANMFHQVETKEATIVQSFISPASFTTDTGVEIKKGTWLQWWQFPETDIGEALWQGVKSGEITGVSIGAMATAEDLE